MKLIAAVDRCWGIGLKDNLLVRIPEDHKRFRQITTGNVVILGRKTLAGFPNGLPLTDRTNIVVSRNEDFSVRGAEVVHSKEELLEKLKEYDSDSIYIIGGGSIYEMLCDYCDTAYITKLNYRYQADTFFPNLDKKDNWEIVDESDEQTYFSIEYNYVTYRNNSPKPL